jgi:hypothetical protein
MKTGTTKVNENATKARIKYNQAFDCVLIQPNGFLLGQNAGGEVSLRLFTATKPFPSEEIFQLDKNKIMQVPPIESHIDVLHNEDEFVIERKIHAEVLFTPQMFNRMVETLVKMQTTMKQRELEAQRRQ